MGRIETPFLLGCGQDPDPEGLGEVELGPGLGPAVALQAIVCHAPGDGQTEDRLGGIDAVSAGQGDPGLGTRGSSARDHLAGDLG